LFFDSKDALIFFYGIFWATTLPAMSRFGPFEVTWVFRKGNARKRGLYRCVISALVLNVGPVLWFWILYGNDLIIPISTDANVIMASAFASLSVFGFSNLTYALFAPDRPATIFYTQEKRQKIICDSKLDRTIKFRDYFVPAIGYFVFWPLVAWLVAHCTSLF